MKNKVAIIGGGTYNPVTNHFGLASYAGGGTARRLFDLFSGTKMYPDLYLSKMAGGNDFHTNDDLEKLVEKLKADPETKIIVMTAAVCDFRHPDGSDDVPRPSTRNPLTVELHPAKKIVSGIRDEKHKHIFLVAFKQTAYLTPDKMYLAGLKLCKESSCNLVVVNDTGTGHNMIVTPEEASYADGEGRDRVLRELVYMAVKRSHLSFTRSTVISGESVPWDDSTVPESLRKVVDYCIEQNAYKPFQGSTTGHFACKLEDNVFLTSKRRTNFNDLKDIGLVLVVTDGPDDVYAYGAKPSVGGQSQRIVFSEHEGMDCIVHFHCPLKADYLDDIPVKSQKELECGSHECGQNTSNGLKQFGNLKAVYLAHHGPNIVFSKDIDPQEVIDFIDRNFDLSMKTGGYSVE